MMMMMLMTVVDSRDLDKLGYARTPTQEPTARPDRRDKRGRKGEKESGDGKKTDGRDNSQIG